MDEARPATFADNFRQEKNIWAPSGNGESPATKSLSLGSCVFETSGAVFDEKNPDEITLKRNRDDANKRDKAYLSPSDVYACVTSSSSSLMSSSLLSNNKMTSSHDNGPSSDASTPENNRMILPFLNFHSRSKLLLPKTSEDDDVDGTEQKEGRVKKVSFLNFFLFYRSGKKFKCS